MSEEEIEYYTRMETELDEVARRLVDIAVETYGNGLRCQEKIQLALERWYRLQWATPTQPRPNTYIPQSLRKAVFERDQYRCRQCGSWIDLCVDHIHPLSKGGAATLENLQTLCRPCNSRKHDKAIGE